LRAIDDVLNRSDTPRTTTTDFIPVIRHAGHPKVRPTRLIKRQGPKRNRVQYLCSHCAETGDTRRKCQKLHQDIVPMTPHSLPGTNILP
jgi:hypothetical protein